MWRNGPAAIGRLPPGPGAYRFRDAGGRVLYIGRASGLRSRVGSYWSDLRGRDHLAPMVERIASVEAVSCDSERALEATPPGWREFMLHNAELAARLAQHEG